ncbi:MAG: HAMP domain-containing histidine kinase [Lachnospiraceae bacterium]|jgi:signal transduction histidine kinase|nr:HAMP domain-containing histidine kinase [Lachnospiraceae bacterium]
MKNLSIRVRITMWFTVSLMVMAIFTCFIILYADHQIIQKSIRDNLIETVENNVDEVEFYWNMDKEDPKETDYYLAFGGGYLEIDDDFLDEVNGTYTSLYQADGRMIYGENPISQNTADLAFADVKIQRVRVKGSLFYVFDRKLDLEEAKNLWLRGVVSGKQGVSLMSDIAVWSLVFLPFMVLASVAGGYYFARRMLLPIQEISESAAAIGTGVDLKKRIEIGEGNDELHQLAESFNGMFQRLEDAFETERRFTSDASHELRTPVAVITAQCEYSLEQSRSGGEYKQALQTIQRQSRKMSKLINDMLDFTRLEMRSERYALESVNLTELVQSVCFDMAMIKERGITLKCEADQHIIFNGNLQLLSRLLTNLISNAYRYGRDNGHIFVRLKRTGHGLELSVLDDGIGIAPRDQPRIFGRFYQADHSHSGTGTGLGLSMVQEITKFHGGEIHVESEVGKGSGFYIIFKN